MCELGDEMYFSKFINMCIWKVLNIIEQQIKNIFFYVSKLDFYTKAVWQPYELKLNILPLFT